MTNILKLITAPNPILKMISQEVTEINDDFRKFLDDMVTTMYDEGGVGLAAVQVGVLKRALVMDIDYDLIHDSNHHHHDHSKKCNHYKVHNSNPQFFINPEIVAKSSKLKDFNEGCLSFPGARAKVSRPESVTVKFLDYYGEQKIIDFDGIAAVCIQHEIDHLNGIVFVDHISQLKRQLILNKMKKLT